jgi:hypothetical protein
LAGDQGLLGQCEGRTAATVVATLRERTHRFRDRVAHVAIDPPSSFATALRHALPHAILAVDHFHLVRLANNALTKVRRSPGICGIAADAIATPSEPTRGDCCGHGNACRTKVSPRCGTEATTGCGADSSRSAVERTVRLRTASVGLSECPSNEEPATTRCALRSRRCREHWHCDFRSRCL